MAKSGRKTMFTRDKTSKSGSSSDEARETVTTLPDSSTTLIPPDKQGNGGHSVTRHFSIPPAPSAHAVREARNEAKDGTKKLIVGQGISLDGKISSCDRLIVDGKVEAELQDCHTVEITENGTFKGAAEIAGAEISGHYDGSLTVRENLLIRSTGRVTGTVRYGRLHIEDGGEINGDVKSISSK
jgi:cytoskeletal protein CcmA (bactofilin family)